jgi:hypothetical protein
MSTQAEKGELKMLLQCTVIAFVNNNGTSSAHKGHLIAKGLQATIHNHTKRKKGECDDDVDPIVIILRSTMTYERI